MRRRAISRSEEENGATGAFGVIWAMGSGTIRLFRFAGVEVFLHFSWFLVAAYWVTVLSRRYEQIGWAIAEYCVLFVVVLLHEFGHAFACRSTGGRADRIVLWPLGGIAYVQPPPRPGAILWSTAAGPLVNVALIPVFELLIFLAWNTQLFPLSQDGLTFLTTLRLINFGLLIFNLLPIYPLDGGQMLRALLWFPFGPIRSLQVASVIGFLGAFAMAGLAFMMRSIWFGILAFFVLSRAIAGWQQAQALQRDREAANEMPIEPMPPRA